MAKKEHQNPHPATTQSGETASEDLTNKKRKPKSRIWKTTSKQVFSDTKKKIKVKVAKDKHEKVSFREGVEEFPIKMIKEANKIKWPSSKILTKKYVSVLIFMVCFAAFFALMDWGLQALFALMKVI